MPTAKVKHSYIVNKKTGEHHCVSGLEETSDEPVECSDFGEHMIYTANQLPPRVDLRPWTTPVESQG